MQRGVESHWPAVRGTRFVAPARRAGGRPLLSRAIVRITPCSTRAALAAAQREPTGSVRRAARSLALARPAARRAAARHLPGGSRMRMTAPRAGEASRALAGLAQSRRLTAPGGLGRSPAQGRLGPGSLRPGSLRPGSARPGSLRPPGPPPWSA